MKTKLAFILFCISNINFAQNNKVIDWINTNAVSIKDTDFSNELSIPKNQLNYNFINADIFGFGEATHNNKEFFELKSKFFKYLVLNQGVKTFVLEESFGACYFINEYIQGNGGNLKELILNFQQGIWKNQELFELISWMKSYNDTKANDEKIQFYGNDCMFNYGITAIIKEKIQKDSIALTPEELELVNFFSKEFFIAPKSNSLASKLIEIRKLKEKISQNSNSSEFLLYAFDALEQFNQFLIEPSQENRDRFMAENVEKIYNSHATKIFIWAHNDHIKKTAVFRDKTPSMGNWLHQKFKTKYYALGFEFGIGELVGYNQEKKIFENVILDKPIKNTNSEFFFDANPGIFYIDFDSANKNDSMKKFLLEKRDYIQIGGFGLVLKYLKHSYASEKYNEMFDGLIYIKKISLSKPLK